MKCEKKGNLVNRQVTVGQEDLEQINRLTRREFSQEELYCFRVVLCDNDVDRQMERFDEETLEQLARMFVGKTGICDHQPKTANQLARIYQAQVEYFAGKPIYWENRTAQWWQKRTWCAPNPTAI